MGEEARPGGSSSPTSAAAQALAAGNASTPGSASNPAGTSGAGDPFTWLEDRDGPRVQEWVRAHNALTLQELGGGALYRENYAEALKLTRHGDELQTFAEKNTLEGRWVYQLQNDAAYPRGLWRRTSLESFRRSSPQWEPLIDLDRLAKSERRDWSWGIADPQFAPGGDRCMVSLGVGGGLAGGQWREFDVRSRSFPADGFVIENAGLSSVAWRDRDTLLVSGRVRDAAGATDAGPWVTREWRRGQPLTEAKVIHRGAPDDDVSLIEQVPDGAGNPAILITSLNLANEQTRWLLGEDGQARKLNLPAEVGYLVRFAGQWVFTTTENFTMGSAHYREGSLLSASDAEVVRPEPRFRVLIDPAPRQAIDDVKATAGALLVTDYENARGRIWRFTFAHNTWHGELFRLPQDGSTRIALASPSADVAYATYESFLTPVVLYELESRSAQVREVQRQPAQFDAATFVTEQHEATSKDGTRVPYFLVRRKGMKLDGSASVLMHAYGGNLISLYPSYSGVLGRLWLERGGAYVLASIRGGGEFGPAWHRAALKTLRQRSYDDFIAVAEDLIARGITSPKRIGITGLSNGGLVMAVAINQRPDLFGAAILEVGVLDTLRVDLMSTPAVVNERGSPAVPAERAFLERTSPYENLRNVQGFPVPLLFTATTDDVVHPAMTRRYAAKLESLGMPFYFYESAEGGHGYGVTPEQLAVHDALVYTYLAERLLKLE
jgi:prolyl oligopeptidase